MMMVAIYLCYCFALSSQSVAEGLFLLSDTQGVVMMSNPPDQSLTRESRACSSSPAAVPVPGPSQGAGAGLAPAGAQDGFSMVSPCSLSPCRPWAVCCTSCATSPCPLGRARWPFVMATSPSRTTRGTRRTCTASSVSLPGLCSCSPAEQQLLSFPGLAAHRGAGSDLLLL